jgi:hypothetical protein
MPVDGCCCLGVYRGPISGPPGARLRCAGGWLRSGEPPPVPNPGWHGATMTDRWSAAPLQECTRYRRGDAETQRLSA